MVNTFITTEPDDDDYSQSASTLDPRRLNKQILEAFQMANAIEDAIVISNHLNIPVPKQCTEKDWKNVNIKLFLEHSSWLKTISEKYKKLPEELVWKKVGDKIVPIPVWAKKGKYIKVWDSTKFEEKGDSIVVGEKTYQLKYCCFSSKRERVVGNGFMSHPCTRMWSPYIKALKLYHNSHVKVFRELYPPKSKNAKPRFQFEVTGKIVHPWWRYHESSWLCFRVALLRKEYSMDEKPHYQYHSTGFFVSSCKTPYFEKGYVWHSNLTKELIETIILEEEDVNEICTKVNHRFKRKPILKLTKLHKGVRTYTMVL